MKFVFILLDVLECWCPREALRDWVEYSFWPGSALWVTAEAFPWLQQGHSSHKQHQRGQDKSELGIPYSSRGLRVQEGTGNTLASSQTPAWARWLHQLSQYLCPQCWRQGCWEWVCGNVPKPVCPATLMEISVPNLLSWVKDLGCRSPELCQLRVDPAFWEQWWETACAGIFSSNCTFHTKSFG